MMRAQRYKHALSLIMLDIDSFKSYNDKFGHLKGDEILKQVAEILKKNCRHVDIVARYGGEEFMVILPDTEIKGAKILAEKIRNAVQEIKLTVSAGVAGYEKDMTKDEFIEKVDKALYKAKADGKNKVCVAE